MKSIQKSDFNFELPEANIAKYPLANRDESKLLVYRNGETSLDTFSELPLYLQENDLVIMNNAKVIPARLYFERETGAAIEVLLLEPVNPSNYDLSFRSTATCSWKCIIGNSKKWKDNEKIYLAENPELISAVLLDREERIVELKWKNGLPFNELLEKIGEMPLPPYLNRETEEDDYTTYQTVFAQNEGSVAAPTAGLHFTDKTFNALQTKSIKTEELTLHVGAGTFLPVKEENVLEHDMHREHFEIKKSAIQKIKNASRRIAVGTTTLRVLESLYWIGVRLKNGNTDLMVNKLEPYETETNLSFGEALIEIENYLKKQGKETLFAATEIMILPHYSPKSIVALITNFHLPESTLLMLISSVVGEHWKEIYRQAIEQNFRFLSYGDSSILFVE
ncbi:MAG: S-adenosylmethionine:tRNA ribosyltransferase-isomerase [Bacteroidia bacterium]|nr:S-adenosylmethionine:tRNA ribosyltransferase-isomerase [Bacteroidia bacterium]